MIFRGWSLAGYSPPVARGRTTGEISGDIKLLANRNFLSSKLYQMEAYPVQISCTFTVTPTNGAGVTNLTGGGVANVFMHTSTTPATGNPNPANGIILVQLQDCYNRLLGMDYAVISPLSGTPLTSVTANTLYVITALGTTTAAQWQAKGLPSGITPAVGVPFIATASGAIGGTGAVQVQSQSGIGSLELIGNAAVSNAINPNAPAAQGMYLMLQALSPTNSSTTTPVPTAPAAGSQIEISFYLSNSSVVVQGQ